MIYFKLKDFFGLLDSNEKKNFYDFTQIIEK